LTDSFGLGRHAAEYRTLHQVEALLGVKKALEINLRLYQVWNPSPILQIAIACRVPCES
jgi:hypothetical protein